MSKTTILYKDIAPGAAEDASISSLDALGYSDPSTLANAPETPAVASCELNYWGLDGTFELVDGQPLAFWSEELSDGNCEFANPPVITIEFSKQYSSTGITLVFDQATGIFCREVNVKWYQGEEVKAEETYYPNAVNYFCQKNVEVYSKIVVTILKTWLPHQRAKLSQIIFGVYRAFGMDEIRSASVVNEMDLLSTSLPESTMRWTLDSRQDIDFMFQLKQPIHIENDGVLIGVYYIDSHRRTAQNVFEIESYDAFGVLNESMFLGGVYKDKSAMELLQEIVGDDFEIDFEVEDTTLTGAIEYCTRRDAIKQVLFRWGVCASTDGRLSIRVFRPNVEPKEIGRDKTFVGASVETASIVTEVTVLAHTYEESSDGSIEINGVRYSDTTEEFTVKNPNVTATDKPNAITILDATLVSPDIGQEVAQRVYDYYLRRSTHHAKIVWMGEGLGDCVTLPNNWGSTNTGNIQRMEITISNTVVATCETVGV